MSIKDKIKELNDTLLIIYPGRHLDCSVKDLNEFRFLTQNIKPIDTLLWEQAMHNVAVKLYDLDLLDISIDPDNIVEALFDSNIGMDLCYHFLAIDEKNYRYVEEGNHFLVSDNEKISVKTIYKGVAEAIIQNYELSLEMIKFQLRNIDKQEWFDFYKNMDEDLEMEDFEEIFNQINDFIDK